MSCRCRQASALPCLKSTDHLGAEPRREVLAPFQPFLEASVPSQPAHASVTKVDHLISFRCCCIRMSSVLCACSRSWAGAKHHSTCASVVQLQHRAVMRIEERRIAVSPKPLGRGSLSTSSFGRKRAERKSHVSSGTRTIVWPTASSEYSVEF